MKDKYTYSEVLFGAREEYEKIREKLKRLAELTKVRKSNEVVGIEYKPFAFGNEMGCSYEQNPHTLKGIDNAFRHKTGYYPNPNLEEVVKSNNHYHLTDNSGYGIFIPKEDQEEFDKLVCEISSSDFKYAIKNSNIFLQKPYVKFLLNENFIKVQKNDDISGMVMNYYYSKDSVEFTRLPIKGLGCSKEEIIAFLNNTINSEFLGEEFCTIIDNSSAAHKNVIIPYELDFKNPTTFDICEQEKEMTLVRRPKNSRR